MSTNIFYTLRADHDSQRALMEEIDRSEADPLKRGELLQELRLELQAHSQAEERAFYAPLLAHRETQWRIRRLVLVHGELDARLQELIRIKPGGEGWHILYRKFHEQVNEHLQEEETIVFPLAAEILSEEQKVELSVTYRREKHSEMHSRPH